MKALSTIVLLFAANVFMTIAWYGHLKFAADKAAKAAQAAAGATENTSPAPLIVVIAVSWGIAFFEYCLQIPANRIGFAGSGGPFSLFQLKIIQEVLSLTVFVVFALTVFRTETLRTNHLISFALLIGAVFFAFKK